MKQLKQFVNTIMLTRYPDGRMEGQMDRAQSRFPQQSLSGAQKLTSMVI